MLLLVDLKEVSYFELIIFIERSDNMMITRSKGYEEFIKRKDFGSPVPEN